MVNKHKPREQSSQVTAFCHPSTHPSFRVGCGWWGGWGMQTLHLSWGIYSLNRWTSPPSI